MFVFRAAAKYLASLQKDGGREDKWYRCITAPKDLFTELVSALGISATLSTDKDYLMSVSFF